MGIYLFDQYSLLHFSVGVIAYFFGIKWYIWLIAHGVFEMTENTDEGMRFINKWLKFWPGGKPWADSYLNRVGDVFSGMVGWFIAYFIDNLGTRLGWYTSHLQVEFS